MLRGLIALVICLVWAPEAFAHVDTPTLVLLEPGGQDQFNVKIDVDLTLITGSAQKYHDLVKRRPGSQDSELQSISRVVRDDLRLMVGEKRLDLEFRRFEPVRWLDSEPVDTSIAGKRSTFYYIAEIPRATDPVRLVTPVGTLIEFPIAFSVRVPAKNISTTDWLVTGMRESNAVDWVTPRAVADNAEIPEKKAKLDGVSDPDQLSWWRQFPIYLQLGFRHIIPEGTDHILFVIGLFFLGATFRKLISQTTVFTVAHATTLFLSTYGIFRLPPQYVEPLIAFSIAVIGIENIFRPKLGPARLLVVFIFGLIHGLGFAASLSDIPFPQNDFIMALLGFNLGVDLGQLAVIAALLVLIGWASGRTWYRGFVAIPASLAISVIGLFWMVERITLYRTLLFG